MFNTLKTFFVSYFQDKKLRHSLFVLTCIVISLTVLFFSVFVVSYLVVSLTESEHNALTFASTQLIVALDDLLNRYELLGANLSYNNNLVSVLTTPVHTMPEMISIKDNISTMLTTVILSFSHNAGSHTGLMPTFQEITIYAENPIFSQHDSIIEYFNDYKDTPWYVALRENPHEPSLEYNEEAVFLARTIMDVRSGELMGAIKIKIPLYKINKIINSVFSDAEYDVIISSTNGEIILSTLSKTIIGENFNEENMKKTYFIEDFKQENLGVIVYTLKDKAAANATVMTAVMLSIFVFFVVACIVFFLTKVVSKSLAKIFEDFAFRVQKIHYVTEEEHEFPENSSELGLLGKELNTMIKRIADFIIMEKSNTQTIHNMQLEMLQAQINPHLLYNTLSTISYKAKKIDAAELDHLSQSLIEFYRGILNHGMLEHSLKSEIKTLTAYCDVMKLVYELNLDIVYEIDETLLDCTVIKLILQPLVENSIKHGILPNKEGCIYISAKKTEMAMVLLISDTGRGIPEEKLKILKDALYSKNPDIGYGMSNVAKRLQAHYGDKSDFIINSQEGMGSEITLTIPLL